MSRADEDYEASRRAEMQYPDPVDISHTIHPQSIDSRLLIRPVVENHIDSRGRRIITTPVSPQGHETNGGARFDTEISLNSSVSPESQLSTLGYRTRSVYSDPSWFDPSEAGS